MKLRSKLECGQCGNPIGSVAEECPKCEGMGAVRQDGQKWLEVESGRWKVWGREPVSERGLLLTPSIDYLFDGGFISFKNSGELIVSGVADRPSLIKMGIPQSEGFNAGTFSRKQAEYLEYHRDTILLQARS